MNRSGFISEISTIRYYQLNINGTIVIGADMATLGELMMKLQRKGC